MTPQEASKIAAVAATADNRCPTCIREITKELVRAFPKIDWRTKVGVAAKMDLSDLTLDEEQ